MRDINEEKNKENNTIKFITITSIYINPYSSLYLCLYNTKIRNK